VIPASRPLPDTKTHRFEKRGRAAPQSSTNPSIPRNPGFEAIIFSHGPRVKARPFQIRIPGRLLEIDQSHQRPPLRRKGPAAPMLAESRIIIAVVERLPANIMVITALPALQWVQGRAVRRCLDSVPASRCLGSYLRMSPGVVMPLSLSLCVCVPPRMRRSFRLRD